MKKSISKKQYLQALGLFTISNKYYLKAREAEKELAELLGFDDAYCDQVSDEIVEPKPNFDKALKAVGITVKDNNK